jgi:Uma2 family endonuclease
MVFDDNGEQQRFTATPHLVVEILSSGPARDIIRKAAKYAAAGVKRYWIIDRDGPEIIVHELVGEVLVGQRRHRPGTVVTLDVGPAEITLDPSQLLE